MKVYVTNHATDRERLFEGTPAHIQEQVLFAYPFLRTHSLDTRGGLGDILERLDGTGYYEVTTQGGSAEDDNHLIESEMADGE